jgi:hypothetical protein
VGAIHQLFQIAFRMKQHEVDLAKKGQDDTASNGSGDSKKENSAEVRRQSAHFTPHSIVTEVVLFTV